MSNQVISGGILVGFLAVALFFLRFWKKSADRFFLLFAVAFGVLAMERLLLVTVNPAHESVPFIYLARLLAYSLIIFAIVDKNRARQ